MVIVGSSAEFDKPPSALVPVVPVDTTIPSPSGGKKVAAREWEDGREY